MDNNNQNQRLNWDDEISGDVREFADLKPGLYKFDISSFERKYTEKDTQSIPQGTAYAELGIHIVDADGREATIKERFYLLRKFEWKINSLFVCVGLMHEGQKSVMPWNRILGSTGVCEVYKQSYNDRQYDHCKSFLTPAQVQKRGNILNGGGQQSYQHPQQNTGWSAGKF